MLYDMPLFSVDCEIKSARSVTNSENEDESLPTIIILATGGTIAGTGTVGRTTNYQPGQLDVGSLVMSAAGVDEIARIRVIQVCNVNSDDITDKHWLQLARIPFR